MQGDINQVTVLLSETPLIIFQLSFFSLLAIPLLTYFMLLINSLNSRDMLLMNCVCCWTLSLVCVYIIYIYIFSHFKPKKKARNKTKIPGFSSEGVAKEKAKWGTGKPILSYIHGKKCASTVMQEQDRLQITATQPSRWSNFFQHLKAESSSHSQVILSCPYI